MPHVLHLIPSELAATLWSHISMLPNAHACILSLSSSLCGSQDDRDAHQVCSGEDQRPQKRSLLGRLFPGRDQDCLWFMGQDDQSLGFGCAASPQIRPSLAKLTPADLSGRQTGAAERENERSQQRGHVSGVFLGRDQNCVRIVRPDDQSLGFGCAKALKIAPPWPN